MRQTKLPVRPFTFLISGWIAATVVVGALVYAGRTVALDRAQRSSAAFALAVQESTARTFQAIDLTLRAIADAHHLKPRPGKNDPDFQLLLSQRLKDLPYVRAIFIIGPDGFLIHDTDFPRTPDVSLADRAYFKLHQSDPALERSISAPLLSRSGTGWFLPVAHRLGRGARFEGLVVAAVQADYFEELYERIGVGDGDVIALFHRSGTLVARYPGGDQDVGKSFENLPLFAKQLAESPNGTYLTAAGMFPGERVVSYRAIEGTPLVVRLSRSNRSILAEWRRTAVGAGVAMGALTIVLAVFIAYLARERLRRERARLRRAQVEKLEALGELTGGMAHDFGNLLNIVSMNLEILELRPFDEQRANEAIRATRRAVARGAELIKRLLAFAKRQPLKMQAVDLNEVVSGAQDLLAQAAGPRIEIVQDLAADAPRVICDDSQLEIALLNLVVNARDAMSGAGRITLRTLPCADDYVCLVVQDDGPGMTEAIRRRALEPFFSTKGDAGTGLGLSQVYGFMQQIGGDLRIDSAPGKGTTVRLFFRKAHAGSLRADAA